MQQREKSQHGVALQRASTGKVCVGKRGHIQSDGGLQKSGLNDDNNCTIRAFAIAFGMPYKDAHYMGELAGRQIGEGYWMYKIMNKAAEFGYSYKEINGYGTLSAFLNKNNKGRFICVRRGHAFAVLDGKIYDQIYNAPNCKLIRIFEVFPKNSVETYIKENFCV
jgi:hypothetical protein